jgi:hypothetical protein
MAESKESTHPETDEESVKDPHKASWRHDSPLEEEYEADETAGVVIVESEVLSQIYAMLRRKRFRLGVPEDAPEHLWLCKVSVAIAKVLNDYHQGDFRDTNCLAIGELLMSELMDDISGSLAVAPVFMEDAVGFSVISGTTKIMVHFSQEDLDNAGIVA